MAGVSLHGVSKIYPGGVVGARDIDLEIADGEFVVLVGPSGCGKSTCLRMVAGLESATVGELRIGDRVVNDVEPKDRDIAMVFQSYALYPHMSVRENMAFGLKLRRFPREMIDRKVDEAAAVLGIRSLLDRKPRALSGGQRQRVALGRAIVRDPAVFLFDEPLSNLDAKMRVQMRTEISRLHHKLDATMIYVTHDQVEAMTMGQRIVVMNEGRIQQVDTPLNLYDAPANRFVAGFIGSPAMNFLSGHLDGDTAFILADGDSLPLPAGWRAPPGAGDGVLVLGVRPEHLGLAGPDSPASFKAVLRVLEPLGNETLLYLEIGDQPLVVRAPGHVETPIDEPLDIALPAKHLHLFAADAAGARLT